MIVFLRKKVLQNSNWAFAFPQKNLFVLSENHPFLKPLCEISFSSVTNSNGSSNQQEEEEEQQQSFTVSYLINSCGLSQEAAKSVSKKVQFETPERPDSVLNLLINNGFSMTHISTLVRKRPHLLLAHPSKIVKPKLDFFSSAGIPPSDLVSLFCCNPSLLRHSLVKRIIPAVEFLKSILGTNKDAVIATKRCYYTISFKFMVQNVAFLRDHRVPESGIVQLVRRRPCTIMSTPARFNVIVNEVKEMGFDPLKCSFVVAVNVLSQMSKSTWKRKSETYKKWGWSENDIISAFRKCPNFMTLSAEKAEQLMVFLVISKTGWNSLDVARCPTILTYSLKQIISRCLVIQLLLSKKLIKKKPSLGYVVKLGQTHFLDKFVTKYHPEVPELLNFYQRNMDELGYPFDVKC